MKKPDELPDNLYEILQDVLKNRQTHRLFRLSNQSFEEQIGEHIRFWKAIGRPDKETLTLLMVWEELAHNRELTAFLLGLSSRECIRQILVRLRRNYLKNTEPEGTA